MISTELNVVVGELLQKLLFWQERAKALTPLKAQKRLLSGLRCSPAAQESACTSLSSWPRGLVLLAELQTLGLLMPVHLHGCGPWNLACCLQLIGRLSCAWRWAKPSGGGA